MNVDEHNKGRIDRCRGTLLGLAVGDAVGTTLEFEAPGMFERIRDMVGGGPFNLLPGQWTDDTSMALCLAESLVACRGFDAADQMQRYVRWWREGENSSTGVCFDIGGTVARALRRFEQTGEPFAGSDSRQTAGNGSLMRLAPVAIAYADDAEAAIRYAAESSRTTHGAPQAMDGCRFFSGLLLGAMWGERKKKLLRPHYHPEGVEWWPPLDEEVEEVTAGSFREEGSDICGSGYVVKSLEAALWAFDQTGDFEEGCLLVANLGEDADTTAAIYGQIAGAHYGASGIPPRWLERLHDCQRIAALADALAGGTFR